MPLVSIIVPVYNVEKYLRKCVDSILAQTFTDFECILVDDGSTDGSPGICNEYAKKDSRIVVIHQNNGGLPAARNTGLDRTAGEWIGFVDSDDWCESEMFQFLYENAMKSNADVSICIDRHIIESTGEIVNHKNTGRETIFDNHDDAIYTLFQYPFGVSSCSRLLKVAVLREHHIRYDPAQKDSEDILFSYHLFKCSKRIIYSPAAYYNYLQRQSSISHKPPLKRSLVFRVYDTLLSLETNKKLQTFLHIQKAGFASSVCYLAVEDHIDERYKYFAGIAKANLLYVFRLRLPLRDKISRCLCLLFPKAFVCCRRKYRTLKSRLKK